VGFSSGVVWEEKKKRHWKAFNHQVCEQLEEAYQRHQKLQMAGKPGDPLFTTGRLEVLSLFSKSECMTNYNTVITTL